MATKKVKQVTLAILVAATLSETGFMFADEKSVTELVKHGYAEVNTGTKDANGNVGVRATEAGIAAHNNAQAAGVAVEEDTPADTGFAILNATLPESKSKRGRQMGASKYPFDKLEVNQSFFVPNSENMADAYKGMASSVTGANKRFAEVIEGETVTNRKGVEVPATRQTREFKQVRIEDGKEYGFEGVAGTLVGRIS